MTSFQKTKVMKNFYGISKPSQAIRAMIRGLLENSEREDFRINMHSYGHSRNGICYGCAATCALQELSGISLTKDLKLVNWPSGEGFGEFLGKEQSKFEGAINGARAGFYTSLLEFFGVEDPKWGSRPRLNMGQNNWREQIEIAEKLAESWEADNL